MTDKPIKLFVQYKDDLRVEVLKVSGVVFNSTGELIVFPVDEKGEETGEVRHIRRQDFITANVMTV